MITSAHSQTTARKDLWARALLALALACLMGTAQALDTQVNIYSVYAAAEEQGPTPGQFLVTRNDATSAITVNFAVTGTADFSDDYTTSNFTGTVGLPTANGTLVFAVGALSATISITPVDDIVIEGAESISIALQPSAFYQLGNFSSALVQIADDDLLATINRPDNVANEDGLDSILGFDGNFGRRAVYRVSWTPDTGVTPVPFQRTIRVRFDNPSSVVAGVATLATDYEIHHKIIGDDNSYIGCVTTATETTGLGYKVYGHLQGETVIQVSGGSGSITTAHQVRFGASLVTYSVIASTTTNGIGTITVSPPLGQHIANNASVTVLGAVSPPTGYAINVPYPADSTISVKVGSGARGIRIGDVFRIADDEDSHYVVTASSVGSSSAGVINFTKAFNTGGLNEAIAGVVDLETYFSTPLAGNVATIDIPALSDRIEFSITPKLDDASGPEGAETVTMTLDTSIHYAIKAPTSSTVIIADRDVSAAITTRADAQRPSTSGKFLVTLTGGPFPTGKNVDVRYVISGSADDGVDYEALDGLLVIPAGSSTGEIEVKPIDPGNSGTRTVTVALLNSYDFVLSGSSGSGTNASATMNISDSAGLVSIANGADAQEAPTPTPSFMTVTLARTSAGPINVNYSIGGSAANSRYQALGAIQITGTTATITVTPRDNSIADGAQDVIVTLLPGNGYGLGAMTSGAVRIRDDEPTVSVIDQLDASKGGANGFFTIGYPGVPTGTRLTRAIRVYFELAGTAILNTDFSTNAVMTTLTAPYRGYIEIPGSQLSIGMSITGLETPADGTEKDMILTILPDAAYTIGANANSDDDELTITGTPTPNSSKPTPGSINSGSSSSGGCGLGSGVATLLGLAAFALMALRIRRDP